MLTLITGVAIGAVAIEALHAQAKAVYTCAEIQIADLGGYMKEFAPIAQAALKTSGSFLPRDLERPLRESLRKPALRFGDTTASKKPKLHIARPSTKKPAKWRISTAQSSAWLPSKPCLNNTKVPGGRRS